MAQADLFFPDRQSLFRKQHPENLLYFLMCSLLIFNFVKHIASSFRMTLIPQGYGCGISHSRIYLISTTHSFLISYRFFFSTVFVLDSPAAAPYLWQGTLQADASLRIARRFSESLADYNLESILFLLGRNSYHYPPQMILAKDLQKSIHSYKDSLRMRTGTDSFLTK